MKKFISLTNNSLRRFLSSSSSSSSSSALSAAEVRPFYLDYQATTPMDPRVLDEMLPYMKNKFGNPHSRSHFHGWEAENAVEHAREQIAKLINADAKEIIFTSGATESNNLALKGVASFYKGSGDQNAKNHIITVQTEHKCVLDSCRWLEQRGFEITYLPVKADGLLDLKLFKDAIRKTTIMCSVMGVNNEIGVVQPLMEIGQICKDAGIFFHSDCAQMAGKLPLDVKAMGISLMSLSSHKIYGPKGIGALYIQRKPRVRLEPLMSGGGQERGLRSGTLPTFLCVGFGKACEIAKADMEADYKHVERLYKKMLTGLRNNLTHVSLNGPEDLKSRFPGNLNLSFECVEGESLLMALKGLSISSGSACTSASLEPSYVLRALGVSEENAHTSLRFGFGRFTTEEEVDISMKEVIAKVNKLREMSPLWELVQEGVDLKSIQWTQEGGH